MRTTAWTMVLLGFVFLASCGKDDGDATTPRPAVASPVAVIANFLESMLQGDSAAFYACIDRDSVFKTTCQQESFRHGFSPSRLHHAYFSRYGYILRSPFADKYFPNRVGTMESKLLDVNDRMVAYDVAWNVIQHKGEEPDPWTHQRFRLHKQPWGGAWKITFAEFNFEFGGAGE